MPETLRKTINASLHTNDFKHKVAAFKRVPLVLALFSTIQILHL